MCGARIFGSYGYTYHGPHAASVWLCRPPLSRPANDNPRQGKGILAWTSKIAALGLWCFALGLRVD